MIANTTLGEIANFLSGNAWSASKFKPEGQLPIIRIQNLGENNASSFVYWDDNYDLKFIITKGDMLLSLSGSIKVDVWKGPDALLNQRIVKISPKQSISERWLYWQISNALLEIEKMGKLALVNNVSINDLKAFKVFLPPLEEQKRIVEVLGKADRLRQKDRQLLAHYDQLLQSVFLDMFGETNPDSANWEEVSIKDIAAPQKGSMRTGPFGSDLLHSEFVDEGVFVLGIDNVVNNTFEWGKARFITELKYEKLKRYKVHPGDVLVSIMATTGRTAVVPNDMPEAINSKHLAAITLNRKLAEPIFLSYSLHSDPKVVFQLTAQNRGAIMNGLNLGIIKETKINLPPLSLQEQFAEITASINKQKSTVEATLTKSEELFQSLLQKAFKGELQLKEVKAVEESFI